jgi:hypothetical protein
VCGNAASQPSVNSTSGSGIVKVASDVFEDNAPVHELTLPNFNDSSKQIVLHFLCDRDEYYRIQNVPESLKLPLAMRAVTARLLRVGSVSCTVSYMVMNISKRFLQNFYGIRQPNPGSIYLFIKINLSDKMANP